MIVISLIATLAIGALQIHPAATDLTLAGGVSLRMRADEHLVGAHGAATLHFFRQHPWAEVWYRATPGEEAFWLLGNDGEHSLWCGLLVGARGQGMIAVFLPSMLDGRIAITGWCAPYSRWAHIMARDGYKRVYP
jgi:hypothetical protein